MELIVRLEGREVRVVVEGGADGYRVRVGESEYRLDAVATGPLTRSLIVDGRQFDVSVVADGEGRYRVGVAGATREVEVLDPLTALAQETRGTRRSEGPRTVAAYMPGRVARLLVEEGDEVVAGQGLVVLEAMKMENEIQAEQAGVVRAIHVAAGEAVEGGDPILDLD